MRFFSKGLCVVAILIVTPLTNAFAQTEMVISSWLPPSFVVNATIWPEFIKRVSEATEGRVVGSIEYNLASPPAQADLIEDGGADVAWIFHGYTPGRFVTTKLIELPGLEGNSEAASAAHWRAYEKILGSAGEHEGVVPVAMMVHAPGSLHLAKEISNLDDVAGLKIRSGGGVMGNVLDVLDVAGVQVSASKVYETVANGVADGTFFPGGTLTILRLTEVLPYSYTVPGGFYRGSFAIVMSEDFLARLSDKDRAAVLGVLGEDFSAFAGSAWDASDARGLDAQAKTGKVTSLGGAASAKFTTAIPSIQNAVIDEVNARGVDAQKALELIRATMAEYSAR